MLLAQAACRGVPNWRSKASSKTPCAIISLTISALPTVYRWILNSFIRYEVLTHIYTHTVHPPHTHPFSCTPTSLTLVLPLISLPLPPVLLPFLLLNIYSTSLFPPILVSLPSPALFSPSSNPPDPALSLFPQSYPLCRPRAGEAVSAVREGLTLVPCSSSIFAHSRLPAAQALQRGALPWMVLTSTWGRGGKDEGMKRGGPLLLHMLQVYWCLLPQLYIFSPTVAASPEHLHRVAVGQSLDVPGCMRHGEE